MSEPLQFVDMETARAARGLRLVVAGTLPSPWSEAAKGLLRVAGIAALGVRFRRADAPALGAWTGANNVPVALHDDDPPRTGWADILALTERLREERGGPARVPAAPDARTQLFGLCHQLASEGGLGWCSRLVMIDGSLSSGGARSFPLPVAQFLGAKYGYAPARVPAARARVVEVLALFDRHLAQQRAAGHAYLLGDGPTAADVFLATFLNPMAGLTDADCPAMRPEAQRAFAYLREQIGDDLPPALAAHRALIYERHLSLPIAL